MAVHNRLQRKGNTHRPFYHIVACDHHKRRDGRYLEKLGYYDPQKEPSVYELKDERIQYWYGCGAQLSETVKKICNLKKLSLTRVQTQAKKQA